MKLHLSLKEELANRKIRTSKQRKWLSNSRTNYFDSQERNGSFSNPGVDIRKATYSRMNHKENLSLMHKKN